MLKITTIFLVFAAISVLVPKPIFAAIEFSLANPQSDNDTVTIDVSISGLTANSCLDGTCYLQAAFTSQDQQRYFGFTKNDNGNWYQYDGSPGKENIKSNLFSFKPQSGNWSGTLTIKVDTSDSDYKGPGIYDIKAWRYSGNSNSSSGSSDNTVAIELTTQTSSKPEPDSSESNSSDIPKTSTEILTQTPTSKSSPKNSSKKTPTPSPKILGTAAKVSPQPEALNSPKIENSIAQLDPNQLAAPSPSSAALHASRQVAGILVGSGAVLIGLSAAGFLWQRRHQQHLQIQKGREQFEQKEQ